MTESQTLDLHLFCIADSVIGIQEYHEYFVTWLPPWFPGYPEAEH